MLKSASISGRRSIDGAGIVGSFFMDATRRDMLLGMSLGGVALVSAELIAPEAEDHFCECERLAAKLTEALARKHGGNWKYEINHVSKFALIVPIE